LTDLEDVVINTGPLIALTHGGALSALGATPYKFITTRTVVRELQTGVERGNPAVPLDGIELAEDPAASPPLAVDLDAGEASVIQLALERGIRLVCIDEKLGRRQAEALGLRVFGALGILRKAKQLGHLAEIRPIIDKMRAAGVWYDQRLVDRVCAEVGE
jgi:uncharacterized protein